MPQIAQLAETFSSQVFWLLVFFGLVFFVVGRGMVPKVTGAVELRDKQITDDLAAAQVARDRADEEEEAWRKRENENRAAAQAVVADAKAKAAEDSERKLAAEQERLDAMLTSAQADIAEARKSALGEIEDVAADATQDIVQRLAGVSVTAEAARTKVREALHHG